MKTDSIPQPCACTSLKRVGRILARTYDASLAAAGMNITQLAVLRAVLRHPNEPLTRIAQDLAMDRTSLYRALAAMQKRNWVRLIDGSDARVRTASISKKGRAAMTRADAGWSTTQGAVIERFGRSQWQTLVAELARLADCASAAASRGRTAVTSK
jgi:DNA-binding MarR family transcriptional regulator